MLSISESICEQFGNEILTRTHKKRQDDLHSSNMMLSSTSSSCGFDGKGDGCGTRRFVMKGPEHCEVGCNVDHDDDVVLARLAGGQRPERIVQLILRSYRCENEAAPKANALSTNLLSEEGLFQITTKLRRT